MYGSNVCMSEINSPSCIVTILLIITDKKKKLEYSTSFVIGPIK